MRYIRAAIARTAGVFTRDSADDDLREELQSHASVQAIADQAESDVTRRGLPRNS
jgi:type I restriction-modification system DNA methylase subunit